LLTLIDVLLVDSRLKQCLMALILADDDYEGGLLRLKSSACTESEERGGLEVWTSGYDAGNAVLPHR